MQNGICEAFNGRMRDELLNETIFYDLDHARSTLARWTAAYNQKRPHSALGYLTPAEFAGAFTATGDRLRNPTSCADRPLLRRRSCAKLNPQLQPQVDECRGSQQSPPESLTIQSDRPMLVKYLLTVVFSRTVHSRVAAALTILLIHLPYAPQLNCRCGYCAGKLADFR